MIINQGMEYHEFTANLASGRATIRLLRIDPSMSRFVVGSLSNETDETNRNVPTQYKKRLCYRLDSTIENKKKETVQIIDQSDGSPTTLKPVWISNGTFFAFHPLEGNHDATEVLGPVVHEDEIVTDVSANLINRSAPKSERWMVTQSKKVYNRVIIARNRPRKDIATLARTETEVLGGAGSLISSGVAHSKAFWYSPSGGEFSPGIVAHPDPQIYSTGTIFARCSGANPIYYTIYITGGNPGRSIHWSESASYLSSNQFRTDIASKRKAKQDSPIQEACVFDGGSSRQLWVRGAPTPMRFTGVEVPNYFCVWGRVPLTCSLKESSF